MPNKLIIFIIVLCLCFMIYILKQIKEQYISTKYSLIWLILDILVIIFCFTYQQLLSLAHIIGIETVSNMLFFGAIVLLSSLIFKLTKLISKQNKQIINLTQKMALLEKRQNDSE